MKHSHVAVAFLGAFGATQVVALGCGSAPDGPSGLPSHNELARAADPPVNLPANRLRSLKGVKPPEPKDLGKYVRDRDAAIVLGKAFFWDTQAGSDGQACGSCHFHAGADNRTKNQLSPGLNNMAGPPLSQRFDRTASGSAGGPNYTLMESDYPFHQLQDIDDPNSTVLFDTDDVTSSQGVLRRNFTSITPDAQGRDTCVDVPDIFNVAGVNVRRVEARNTPTMINAVYNFRNFWDGRANNVFNGVSPFGPRDTGAVILELQPNGTTLPVQVRLENASAASQAVGPTLSGFEMSCDGRGFADVGRKLIGLKPLGRQEVAADDSVLGAYRDPSGVGLSVSYRDLISRAFDPKYWSAAGLQPGGRTQMEANFSLYWGLAIMLYEDTLVSDDAPIDRFLDGDESALTPQQLYGKALFEGQAGCINCHHGSLMTGAAFDVASVLSEEITETNTIERMALNDGKAAIYDNGFYNIGVRPTGEDLGIGGSDPYGNPLSFARQAKAKAAGQPIFDVLFFDSNKFSLRRGEDPQPGERDAVDGSFKVPSLRNVELTGPYFHNGGQASLEQVLDFYNRGGDRRGGTFLMVDGEQVVLGPDSTGYGPNETNMDVDVERLFLTDDGKAAIVAFLKSFTDERVRWERAPFDHPQIVVPNGAKGDETTCQSQDDRIVIPAVGKGGRGVLGLPALKGFMEK